MEHVGNALFHAKDDWAHLGEVLPSLKQSSQLSPDQMLAEDWWKKEKPPVDEAITTFVKNRMVVEKAFGATMEDSLCRALTLLSQRGTSRDSQLAECSLATIEEDPHKEVVRSENFFFLGPTFPMEDCESQEFVVGRLTFHLIDYGDQIRLNQEMREQLGTGEEQERNQCAVLAFAAGYEWSKQGRPKRPPGAKRVSFVAKQHRAGELQAAVHWTESAPNPTCRYDAEMRSIAHEALNVNHERDLRSLNHFCGEKPFGEKISRSLP